LKYTFKPRTTIQRIEKQRPNRINSKIDNIQFTANRDN
jgi:hypothetical protein